MFNMHFQRKHLFKGYRVTSTITTALNVACEIYLVADLCIEFKIVYERRLFLTGWENRLFSL